MEKFGGPTQTDVFPLLFLLLPFFGTKNRTVRLLDFSLLGLFRRKEADSCILIVPAAGK